MCNSPEQKRRKNQGTEDGRSYDVWTIKRLSKLKQRNKHKPEYVWRKNEWTKNH